MAGRREPERDSPDPDDDLALQALVAARIIACKLMDEPPVRPLEVLEFQTESRWLLSPAFTEGWVSDQHICHLISQLPSDVAWAFFMWELRHAEARERWGAYANELCLLHDRVEIWVRGDVIPAWELHLVSGSPRPKHDWLSESLMVPLRAEDVVRVNREQSDVEARITASESDYARPFDETGELGTGARRRTQWFSDVDHGGGWDREPAARPFNPPDKRRKTARPPFYTIREHLERAAYAAGYTTEAFIAPFPRGRRSAEAKAEDERRRNALAIAVHELRAKGSQEKQIARTLSMERKAVQRLNERGAVLAAGSVPPQRPDEKHQFAGLKVPVG